MRKQRRDKYIDSEFRPCGNINKVWWDNRKHLAHCTPQLAEFGIWFWHNVMWYADSAGDVAVMWADHMWLYSHVTCGLVLQLEETWSNIGEKRKTWENERRIKKNNRVWGLFTILFTWFIHGLDDSYVLPIVNHMSYVQGSDDSYLPFLGSSLFPLQVES
jgi:hypothetical protein